MRTLRRLFKQLSLLLSLLPTLFLTACGLSSEPPATLRVRLSTPIPTDPPAIPPTPTIPTGLVANRPFDPAIPALMEQVQNDRLMYALSALTEMQTRHILSRKDDPAHGIGAARDWLLGEFSALRDQHPDKSIDVWTQPVRFTWRRQEVTSENVVAVFPGTNIGAGVVVIGAHYDSVSSDPFDGQAPAPGANENASGAAALLEIAHIMAPLPHRATLVFVAFTAKESGRQGSQTFVESYLKTQQPPIDLRGMINLDMIGSERGPGGRSDPRSLRLFSAEPNDSPSRQFARQLALFINTYAADVNLKLQSAEERTGRFGDHQPFSAAGYPSVRFVQGLENAAPGLRDTRDNVQLAYLMRTTRAILAATVSVADGPLPPASVAMQTLSPGVAALSWSPVTDAAGYVIALRGKASLYYDRILNVAGQNEIAWDQFGQYTNLAVGSVDTNGRVGPLSPEYAISALLRK